MKHTQTQFLMEQFLQESAQKNLFGDTIKPQPCTGIITEKQVLYSHSNLLFPDTPFSTNPLDDLDIRMRNLSEYFRRTVMLYLGWSKPTFYRRKKQRAINKGKNIYPAIQPCELRQIQNAAKTTMREFTVFMEKL